MFGVFVQVMRALNTSHTQRLLLTSIITPTITSRLWLYDFP